MQKGQENCIIDCRVSDPQQLRGGSITDQEEIGRRYADRMGWNVAHVFKRPHSATTTERDDLDEIKAFIMSSGKRGIPINHYVFKCIDRLTRAGWSAYERLKGELEALGVQVHDTYGIIQQKQNTLEHLGGFEYKWSVYAPSEAAEMLTAHQGKQEARDILTRLIGAEIRLTQEGYAIRQAVDGFANKSIFVGRKKKTIRIPDPERAKFFIEIYNLRSRGTFSDEEIVEKINAMGYRSKIKNRWDKKHENILRQLGGVPLTVKQLQRLIAQPAYAGIICEKWTNYQPIKAQWDGLVSIEMFNEANRGKVFIDYQSENDIKILYDYHPEKTTKKRMKDNPLFPYKWAVLCPDCHKPFLGSSPSGKSRKGFPTYHCARGHKYLGVAKKTFDENVEHFIKNLRFDPEYMDSWEATFLNKFHEREGEIVNHSADINRSISELQEDQAAKLREIVASDSPIVKKMLTEQIEALEGQIQAAKGVRNKLEITEDDIKAFVREAKYMMEHPAEMLLNAENPRTQRALFGLVFEETPTYTEILNGTPKLTWIFKLSSEFATKESQLVAPRGIEPRFTP